MKRYPNLSSTEETWLTHTKAADSIINWLGFVTFFAVTVLNRVKGDAIVYDFTSVYNSHPKAWSYIFAFYFFLGATTKTIIAYFNWKMSWSALSKTDVKFENIK